MKKNLRGIRTDDKTWNAIDAVKKGLYHNDVIY